MTALSAAQLALITVKVEGAEAHYHSVQARALDLAGNPNTVASTWADFAVAVAEVEGTYVVWARVQQRINYNISQADDLYTTKEDIMEVVFDMLTQGAKDSSSGRGNDVQRARFDGICRAASDLKYL